MFFKKLIDYENEHRHCLVPLNDPKNFSLALWVKWQRHTIECECLLLQDLSTNKSFAELNKDRTNSINLHSPHKGDFGDALANKTFVSHMKTFHCKMKHSLPHN